MSLIDNFKNLLKINKSYVKVTKTSVQGNKIVYEFEISKDLEEYFTKKSMFIEYIYNENIDLSNVPPSILVIPLISNLLPVIWLTNSELIVEELDETFYNSISDLRENYSCMYEEASFKGKVTAEILMDNSYDYEKEYISLFSYGADSLNTVLKYLDAKPMLLTLWGADVSLDREEGWNAVRENVDQFAADYDLKNFFVKSDFRQFMNTNRLFEVYGKSLKNNGNWWYAVQHGIALVSQAAIIAYIFKVKTILIASTYKHEEEDVLNKTNIIPCASSPIIDNEFKFASCNTIHDSWELTRAQKIQNIIDYSKENDVKFNMHVCWHSPLGINCNICEKCARTYMYIMAIGEDPNDYGFNVDDDVIHRVETDFNKVIYQGENIGGWSIHVETLFYWRENQKIFRQNEEYWKNTAMKWFFDIDFDELIENFE